MSGHQKVVVKKDHRGEWRWEKYVGAEPVSDSNEGYKNKQHAIDMATKHNPDVAVMVEEDNEA